MAVQILTEVWKYSKSVGSARLVLLAIADNADEDSRKAWPSIATLMKKTLLKESTVHRAIRKLCAIGELEATMRKGTTNLFVVGRLRGVKMTPLGVSGWHRGGAAGDTPGVPLVTPRTVIEPSVKRKVLSTSATLIKTEERRRFLADQARLLGVR